MSNAAVWQARYNAARTTDEWKRLEVLAEQLTVKVRESIPNFPAFYADFGAWMLDHFNMYVRCDAFTAQQVQELLDNSMREGV